MTGVIETTQSLVRIPSVNPDYDPRSAGEAHVVDWIVQWAKANNIEVETREVLPGRDNVLLRLHNGIGPHLLLNGHTDTVAIDEMIIPPFSGEIRDGRLWGRGSADMKGPVACMLHALLAMKNNPSSWQGHITLALVVDEECNFTGIKNLLKGGETYDFAIVGEPTKLEVIRGCKGCLRFWVRAHGKAAHSSTPEKGVNAIRAMAAAIETLDDYFYGKLSAIRHPEFGSNTGSVGLIKGGSGVNIVPDFCEISVDIRLLPGQSGEEIYWEIQQMITATSQSVRWEFDPKPLIDAAFCLDRDHLLVTQVSQAVSCTDSRVVNFSCDASKIARAGIPCVILGPGDIAQAHTANESIALEELEQGVAAYIRVIETLLRP